MTWQEEQILNLKSEIARLTAALKAAEQRQADWRAAVENDSTKVLRFADRAEAAEQRVAELETALRKILEPFPNAPMPKYEDIRRIARAALREGDEK